MPKRDLRSLKTTLPTSRQRVELPVHLAVHVELVTELPPDVAIRGFDVHYGSIPTPQISEMVMEVRLTVITGSAEEQQVCLKKRRIHLGRLAEVIDADGRLTRKNDVAFRDDGQAPNPSVSRAHAHIEFDPEKAVFRLFDDRSAHGTTVIRDGSVISVPQGASKGVALRNGDELVLGQARVRFPFRGHARNWPASRISARGIGRLLFAAVGRYSHTTKGVRGFDGIAQ